MANKKLLNMYLTFCIHLIAKIVFLSGNFEQSVTKSVAKVSLGQGLLLHVVNCIQMYVANIHCLDAHIV